MSRPSYDHVAFAVSRTDASKRYEIKRNRLSGVLSCSCSAWRFHKGVPGLRSCKHLAAFAAEEQSVGRAVSTFARVQAAIQQTEADAYVPAPTVQATPGAHLLADEIAQALGIGRIGAGMRARIAGMIDRYAAEGRPVAVPVSALADTSGERLIMFDD